jgi:transcriptional regulator with XRE-family HTH domain
MTNVQKMCFARQLKVLRLRHNWTQGYMAEQIGTTTVNVSRWERGLLLPGLYFRQRLCDLFETNMDELGLLITEAMLSVKQSSAACKENKQSKEAISDHIPPLPSWHVPYARNPFFTGRESILKTLEERFFPCTDLYACHVQALCGIGGIGKTQVALEYAYLHRQKYTAVFWIHAESSFTTITGIRSIVPTDAVPDEHIQAETDRMQIFTNWLKTHAGWLLILDNLTDFSILEKFVALNPMGQILLTTSSQVTGPLATPLHMEGMTIGESTLFLLRRARLMTLHDTINDIPDTLAHQAAEIARLMHGLPLALDQAGAYLEETNCSLSDYLSLYEQKRAWLLERRGRFVTGHPDSVAATVLRAYEKIKAMDGLAADLLSVSALSGSETIPEASLFQGAEYLGSNALSLTKDKTLLYDAISTLRTHSLVTYHAPLSVLSLHPLVREVLRCFLDTETRRLWVERVADYTYGSLEG